MWKLRAHNYVECVLWLTLLIAGMWLTIRDGLPIYFQSLATTKLENSPTEESTDVSCELIALDMSPVEFAHQVKTKHGFAIEPPTASRLDLQSIRLNAIVRNRPIKQAIVDVLKTTYQEPVLIDEHGTFVVGHNSANAPEKSVHYYSTLPDSPSGFDTSGEFIANLTGTRALISTPISLVAEASDEQHLQLARLLQMMRNDSAEVNRSPCLVEGREWFQETKRVIHLLEQPFNLSFCDLTFTQWLELLSEQLNLNVIASQDVTSQFKYTTFQGSWEHGTLASHLDLLLNRVHATYTIRHGNLCILADKFANPDQLWLYYAPWMRDLITAEGATDGPSIFFSSPYVIARSTYADVRRISKLVARLRDENGSPYVANPTNGRTGEERVLDSLAEPFTLNKSLHTIEAIVHQIARKHQLDVVWFTDSPPVRNSQKSIMFDNVSQSISSRAILDGCLSPHAWYWTIYDQNLVCFEDGRDEFPPCMPQVSLLPMRSRYENRNEVEVTWDSVSSLGDDRHYDFDKTLAELNSMLQQTQSPLFCFQSNAQEMEHRRAALKLYCELTKGTSGPVCVWADPPALAEQHSEIRQKLFDPVDFDFEGGSLVELAALLRAKFQLPIFSQQIRSDDRIGIISARNASLGWLLEDVASRSSLRFIIRSGACWFSTRDHLEIAGVTGVPASATHTMFREGNVNSSSYTLGPNLEIVNQGTLPAALDRAAIMHASWELEFFTKIAWRESTKEVQLRQWLDIPRPLQESHLDLIHKMTEQAARDGIPFLFVESFERRRGIRDMLEHRPMTFTEQLHRYCFELQTARGTIQVY